MKTLSIRRNDKIKLHLDGELNRFVSLCHTTLQGHIKVPRCPSGLSTLLPNAPSADNGAQKEMDSTDHRGEEEASCVQTCGTYSYVLCSSVCYRQERLRVGGLRALHSHNVETINHGQLQRATCDF